MVAWQLFGNGVNKEGVSWSSVNGSECGQVPVEER